MTISKQFKKFSKQKRHPTAVPQPTTPSTGRPSNSPATDATTTTLTLNLLQPLGRSPHRHALAKTHTGELQTHWDSPLHGWRLMTVEAAKGLIHGWRIIANQGPRGRKCTEAAII